MFKHIALALFVVGLAAPAPAERFDDLQLVHHATFADGSLESGIDPLNIGALKLGDTGEAGINASWTPSSGEFLVSVTRPADLTGPNTAAGIYATPVNFDVGSIVGLRGTFVAPIGPHGSADVWAVTVAIRIGGADPLIAEPLAAATLQIRGNGARLNTPGASVPAGFPNVPQHVYDAIFHPTDPQQFTLELLVDRKDGRGEATLKVGDAVYSRTYEFAVFRADSGPAITNVGLNVAISNAPGQTASVRMRDFQIFSSKRSSATVSSDPLCPPEFGCRTPTSTEHE